MRNIKLEIEYDGTNFGGWQTQRGRCQPETIQDVIEGSLKRILQENVRIVVSGRTDAGVHALSQAANFKTKSRLSLNNIQKGLNSLLPADVSIKKASEVPENFHARYRAKSKVYRYNLENSKFTSVFQNKFSWHVNYRLDLNLMRRESRVLLGRHDFKSFCASGSTVKSTIRTIKKLSIRRINSQLITIDIEADGFLYNMVRNIVGTLVEIGRGRLKVGELKKILQAKDRRLAGPAAPARGLFLVKVKY